MWIKALFHKYFELVFWVGATVCLALANPAYHAHYSLCPLKLMGITWCPGCGLGHAVSYLFHGDIKSSFHEHWLGIPALIAILYRVYRLSKPIRYFQLILR